MSFVHLRVLVVVFVVLVATSCTSEEGTDAEAFCAASEELDDLDAPADQQGTADETREAIARFKETAPEEISAAVDLFVDRWLALLDVWEAGDFDDAKIDQAAFDQAFESFFSEPTSLADDQIGAWQDTNCSA